MNILKHIPNLFTSLNLLSGCVGIVLATSDNLAYVPVCVFVSAFFDFLDGFFARLLKVKSEIGKQFDSLADMVTFGVLPAFVIFELLSKPSSGLLPYIAFALAIFSAMRLAKFNIDDSQQDVFIGLPTPAMAIFVSGLIFIPESSIQSLVYSELSLVSMVVVLSFLMVCRYVFIALKFESFQWNGNRYKFVVVIGAILLMAIGGLAATSLAILWYILVSLIGNLSSRA